MADLEHLEKQALSELSALGDQAGLEGWKGRYLGKKGLLSEMMKELAGLAPEKKKEFGAGVNRLKEALTKALDGKLRKLEQDQLESRLDSEWLDVTAPVERPRCGRLHPLTAISREIEDIFIRMGFRLLDGPLVEDDWHNFGALNIPAGHPARDMQDTFFTKTGAVLRTHTSSVQVRAMERLKPPLRGIAPGRVFRCEDVDASHDHTFYQVEGLLIDRDVSVANMLHFLKIILREIFGREVSVRLRHGYFPFVEPGFEMDLGCLFCGGKGCNICKGVGFIELLGCGLVHPKVLEACKIDPEEWSGFAFGLGLNRLVMNRYDIGDIRHFLSGDIRFVRQFG